MLRIFAIVMIVVSSASAVIAGVMLVQFELAAAPLRTDTSKAPVEAFGFWRRPPDVKPIMSLWTGTPGVGGEARELIFKRPDRAQDLPRLLLDVTGALELQPTSAQAWFTYFELGSRLGYASERTSPALAMATITGRRQAETMWSISMGALRNWPNASQEWRDDAVRMLEALPPRLTNDQRKEIAGILYAQSTDAQAEMMASLAPVLTKDRRLMDYVRIKPQLDKGK